jgi:hypothetical protein
MGEKIHIQHGWPLRREAAEIRQKYEQWRHVKVDWWHVTQDWENEIFAGKFGDDLITEQRLSENNCNDKYKEK